LSVADPVGSPPPRKASREASRARHEAAEAAQRSRRSAARVVEVEQILAESQARTFALEDSLSAQTARAAELGERLDRADRVMAAMKASLSWRVTAPLRALKQRR